MHRQFRERGFTLLEFLYVLSIIALLAAMLIPQMILQRARVIEIQAQRRLRTIGSIMASYSLSQPRGDYTDFQGLKDAHWISDDLTQTNLVMDYSLVFKTVKASDMGTPASYAVIAYPKPEASAGNLSTFAITEDNVIRVYNPHHGVDPNDPHTWDPVL